MHRVVSEEAGIDQKDSVSRTDPEAVLSPRHGIRTSRSGIAGRRPPAESTVSPKSGWAWRGATAAEKDARQEEEERLRCCESIEAGSGREVSTSQKPRRTGCDLLRGAATCWSSSFPLSCCSFGGCFHQLHARGERVGSPGQPPISIARAIERLAFVRARQRRRNARPRLPVATLCGVNPDAAKPRRPHEPRSAETQHSSRDSHDGNERTRNDRTGGNDAHDTTSQKGARATARQCGVVPSAAHP